MLNIFAGGHVTGKPNSLQEAEHYCATGDGTYIPHITYHQLYLIWYDPQNISSFINHERRSSRSASKIILIKRLLKTSYY